MPIYECKCKACGNRDEVFRNVQDCYDMPNCCGEMMMKVPPRLHVMSEITPYRSMIDGSMIETRKRHKDHLRQHNCIEVGNEKPDLKEIPEVPGRKEAIKKALYQHGVLN